MTTNEREYRVERPVAGVRWEVVEVFFAEHDDAAKAHCEERHAGTAHCIIDDRQEVVE